MRVSAGMLSRWMTCPLQARFYYIDKLPDVRNAKTTFGICIHHALDFYNRTGDLEGAVALFRETWDEPAKLDAEFAYWPRYTSYSGLLSRGIDMLREYHEKQRWDRRKVVASEHRFLVPFGVHQLSGVVDLIEVKKSARDKEIVRIVDYKTTGTAPRQEALRLNVQFTAYIYASLQQEFWLGNGEGYPPIPYGERLWVEYQKNERRGYWYHLMGNKEIDAGTRDDKDFMRLYRVVNEVEQALANNVFVPNISGESCTFCPYTEPCQLPIPDSDPDDRAIF